jgi:hypothetical protein
MQTSANGQRYEIRVQGHLSERHAQRFPEMTVTQLPQGITLLVGPVVDQAALHGLLSRIRDLGIALIAVHCLDC